jgi:hypothetical protein
MFIENFLLNRSQRSNGRPNGLTAGLQAYGDGER